MRLFFVLDISYIETGPRLNIDGHLSRCKDSHQNKKVVKPSYLYNGNPYTGESTSLYWIRPKIAATWFDPGVEMPILYNIFDIRTVKHFNPKHQLVSQASKQNSKKHDNEIPWKSFPHNWPLCTARSSLERLRSTERQKCGPIPISL